MLTPCMSDRRRVKVAWGVTEAHERELIGEVEHLKADFEMAKVEQLKMCVFPTRAQSPLETC